MTDIVGVKSNIQQEEVQYRSGVSEATFNKLGSSINYLNEIVETRVDQIGEVVMTLLTEAQWASLKGYSTGDSISTKKWALINGSSISGSDLATLTGITTLPDLTSGRRFVRVASGDGDVGTLEADQNKAHTHTTALERDDGGAGSSTGLANLGSSATTINYPSSSDGGAEARPLNVALNYFIKINQ